MPRSKSRSTPAFPALAAALALAAAPALAADTFSRTVFFGDSLTDAGYFRAANRVRAGACVCDGREGSIRPPTGRRPRILLPLGG